MLDVICCSWVHESAKHHEHRCHIHECKVEYTQELATTVVALDLVHDRIAAISLAMGLTANAVVNMAKVQHKFKGKKTIEIKGDSASFTANILVTMDSTKLAESLKNTGVVVLS